MPTYRNGHVPYSVVSVVLGSGTDRNGYWEFRCTPAFAARWAAAKREAERRFGRTIYIRTGWNLYRPIHSQEIARKNACAAGNCNGASAVGYSSHGGNWNGRDCLAVDVDPNGLTWDQVDQAMEAVGFSARLITQAMSGIPGGERWHYIDFNAFGPVPQFARGGATDFQEDEMNADQEKILRDLRTTQLEDSKTFRDAVTKQITDMQYRIASMHSGSFLPVKPGAPGGTLAWLDEKLAATAAAIITAVPGGAGIDEAVLAEQLRPVLGDVLQGVIGSLDSLSDEDVERVAQRAAEVKEERERARLNAEIS